MHFSSLADNLGSDKNPLYLLHDDLARQHHTVQDLVKGNVNEHGIVFPPDALAEILREAAAAARIYRPDSFGQAATRRSIAEYYDERVPPSQVLVTPGTSVSYWYCFKLLAEPGDQILTPRPSYPLFDYIAQICGVELTYYDLDEQAGWAIDLRHLEQQIGSRTRAIVLISPHNPTGMVASAEQLAELSDIAARYELPIISDEVFNEFLFQGEDFPRPMDTNAPLVFTLNGFSKLFALPGMKIGWIAVSGEEQLVARSLAAFEMISDTFLPVNEIAQFSAPRIFSEGKRWLPTYRGWIAQCRALALAGLAGCDLAHPAGGFYITLPLPGDEESAALHLLRDHHILVHPGYFYDIAPDHLVMTFIGNPERLQQTFETIAKVARE